MTTDFPGSHIDIVEDAVRRFLITVALAICVSGAVAGTAHGTPPPGIHKSGLHPSAPSVSAQTIHKSIVP